MLSLYSIFKSHISICSIYTRVILYAYALFIMLYYYIIEIIDKHKFIYIYARAVPYLCLIWLSQVPLTCFQQVFNLSEVYMPTSGPLFSTSTELRPVCHF
jgi:hypothetical protein